MTLILDCKWVGAGPKTVPEGIHTSILGRLLEQVC